MHLMAMHVPIQMERFGEIKRFSGQRKCVSHQWSHAYVFIDAYSC